MQFILSTLVYIKTLLTASLLYVMLKYIVWYWLVEDMPSDIVLALMKQDFIARYTVLALARGITMFRQRSAK